MNLLQRTPLYRWGKDHCTRLIEEPAKQVKVRYLFLDLQYDAAKDQFTVNPQNIIGWCGHDAAIVRERSSRTEVPTLPTGLVLDETKSYGDTAVRWLNLG